MSSAFYHRLYYIIKYLHRRKRAIVSFLFDKNQNLQSIETQFLCMITTLATHVSSVH